jgi:polar amino acid transport system substrate-binding protein
VENIMKTSNIWNNLLLVLVVLVLPFSVSAEDKTYVISYSPGTLFHELVRDRMKVVYEEAGIKAEFIAMPHKRALTSGNAGIVDGDVGRVPSVLEKYPNLRRVNVKVMDLNGVVYTTREEIHSYRPEILKEYRVGFVRGVLWPEKKMHGLESTSVDTYEILFEMLLQGRIDIAMATEVSSDKVVAELADNADKIRKLAPFIFTAPIHHYVHKKNESIIPLLEQALMELNNEDN